MQMKLVGLLVLLVLGAALPARVRAGPAPALVAERCGGVDVLDDETEVAQNQCPRYACPASLAAANPGNARDLPFAICNLDALGVDGKVTQPAAEDDGALPDAVAAGDGHAFCAVGESAGAIVQEQCALHDWLAGGQTSLVVQLTHAVDAAVVCVVSLDKRDAAASYVRFTTSGSGGSESWTASTTNSRQCFSLLATAEFDTLRIENGDDESTDGLCVQRVETACGGDVGASCTRDYGESNPPPVAKAAASLFCPAQCRAGATFVAYAAVGGVSGGVCTSAAEGLCGAADDECVAGAAECDDMGPPGGCGGDGACCTVLDFDSSCCPSECFIIATGNRPPICLSFPGAGFTVPFVTEGDAECNAPDTIGQPCGGDAGSCIAITLGPFALFRCVATTGVTSLDSFNECEMK